IAQRGAFAGTAARDGDADAAAARTNPHDPARHRRCVAWPAGRSVFPVEQSVTDGPPTGESRPPMLRRVLAHNAPLGLQCAASALVPLVLIPHFVRTLGAAQYGAIAIALAVLSYAAVIVQYAFHLTGPAELVALEQARERKEFFLDIALARVLLLLGV